MFSNRRYDNAKVKLFSLQLINFDNVVYNATHFVVSQKSHYANSLISHLNILHII